MRRLFTILFLGVAISVQGQSKSKLGDVCEDLQFADLLNHHTETAKLSDFKGKVVVVDFWAPWCSPCVSALPHLESLQQEFKQDLQIITVTKDSKVRIDKFLANKPLALPIAFDYDSRLSRYFPYRTLPHSIIISKEGFILAITSGDKITREVIKKAISNEKIVLPEKIDKIDFDPEQPLPDNSNIIYQTTVTPYQQGAPSMSNTGGDRLEPNRRILAVNLSPRSLYEIAYQFPVFNRTELNVTNADAFKWNEENAVCMEILVPKTRSAERFEIMKQQLANIYNYQANVENKLKKVKVLKVINGTKPSLAVSQGGNTTMMSGGNGLTMTNSGIKVLADFLEGRLGVPVVDETNLNGLYDLHLEWLNENPKAVYAALNKIGIELIDQERKIDILVISDR
ncbi:MAG TPA: redoxin domain-containing protein [Pedobacter sp.]|jgi:thiol-disulfide isomerase/thioredoxin